MSTSVARLPHPPFCIQVELVEGCNLQCTFCGIQGIRPGPGGPYRMLSLDVATRMVDRIAEAGWSPRIEFAMHGEPSLHPEAAVIVGLFRSALPRASLMMTSNGGGFLTSPGPTARIMALFEAGLNVLALDDYAGIKIVGKICDQYTGAVPLLHYPEEPAGNPHRRRKPTERVLVVVQDIAAASAGTHATLNNHAGCGAPPSQAAAGKRCAKPFRELSIRWDGHVAVCCNDWRGIYKCGSVVETPIATLWAAPPFEAARRMLYRGERTFGPCAGCDALSYRPGLLPDQKGRETLPAPTAETARVIAQACAGAPYTTAVQRPWELLQPPKRLFERTPMQRRPVE